uniref:Major sperm protein n=1 Tax=Trichuris muris TaxID=70415 RepID=A0A5S6Q7I7_TRIMR
MDGSKNLKTIRALVRTDQPLTLQAYFKGFDKQVFKFHCSRIKPKRERPLAEVTPQCLSANNELVTEQGLRETKKWGGKGQDEPSKHLKKGAKENRRTSDPSIIEVNSTELFIAGAYYYQRLKYLTVTNWCNQRVAYKIKITHPENYVVNPSMGYINPKDSVLIRLLLFRYTRRTFTEKHYLRLLALPIGLEKPASNEKFWKDAEQRRMSISFIDLPIRFQPKSKRTADDNTL